MDEIEHFALISQHYFIKGSPIVGLRTLHERRVCYHGIPQSEHKLLRFALITCAY